MLQILTKVCLIMLVLLAFAVPGFLLKKFKLVQSESLLSLANILLYVCQPMLSVKAFAVNPIAPSGGLLLNFLWVFLFAGAAVLLSFGASELVFLYMKKNEERQKRDVLVFIGTFSNCAFVGIPFVDMFTNGNAEAMMYIIVFSVAFNILLWTLGAYLITQDKKQISVKKALLNPCTVGCAVGLLLFCVPQINIFNLAAAPELKQIAEYTGNMTAPLSMMIVGVRLADLSPKELFCDGRLYLASFVRLVLSFGLTYLLILPFKLVGLFDDAPYVLLAPVIAMSMPPAASIVAFAEKYGGEKNFAAAAYSLATLLSVVTLPFVLLLITL